VGVVDQAVEHGVAVGGIADQPMSLVDRQLAADDGATAVAVLEDRRAARRTGYPHTDAINPGRALNSRLHGVPRFRPSQVGVELSNRAYKSPQQSSARTLS
jgi:hypothetical protein